WRLVRSNGYKKVLYFCNLRESVEAVASQIVPLWRPYPVLVHHGSLSRQLREETESAMKEARVAACVATSTLEIGIDIGDIDLIVLAEAPWSIASLIQRVGRGNRRESTIRVAAIAHSPEERILLEAMLDTASSGLLPPEPYQPDYSVAVQQIFSLLYQHRDGVAEEVLLELVGILLGSNQAASLLQHLQSCGWIHRVGRVWVASTALIDMGDRGQIHSNIPSSETYKVLDIDSGAMIGTVAGTVDEVFVLARRAWQIQSVSEGTIRVRRFKGQASAALFGKHRNIGAFHRLLPPQLR
ncbi:MAG: hypothetical protein H5U02_14940, partial [Clostridia bacterium]|nr:hypothetical protein [Clostridia bacterium]